MNRKIFSTIVLIIITIALLLFLFSQIHLRDIVELLAKIEPIYLVAGFVLYALSFVLRALRLYLLLNREISIKYLFSIVCVHNMALNIFPARSGELSYIYLLNKNHKVSVGEGVASLILIRFLDIITISLLFSMFTFTSHGLPAKIMNAAKIISIILVLIILLMLIFLQNSDKFIVRLRIISIILNINERHFINYLFRKMNEMSVSFQKFTFELFIYNIIISISSWLMIYSAYFIIIKAMGISIVFDLFLLALSFFFMTSIIPIQGIGGFGTVEGGWTVSFIAVGVTKEIAISSGFLIHIICIIYLSILFLIGLTGLSKFNKTKERYTNQ